MKLYYASIITIACLQPVLAQITVEEGGVPNLPVLPVVEEGVIVIPARVVPRQHLMILPRDLVAPVHPPGTVVKTTETKNYVDVPGQPRRVYNTERSVVIVEGRELPYVTIPVLFEKETAMLLDAESRVSLDETAAAIHEVLKTQPTAVFDIEGHTSTDGTDEFNLTLSADRARRVYQELTERYAIPAATLSAHGYGEMFPTFPEGTEEQMASDRRVLVVRSK